MLLVTLVLGSFSEWSVVHGVVASVDLDAHAPSVELPGVLGTFIDLHVNAGGSAILIRKSLS